MINAGVFSDRHYGGINYPKGGVGQIAQKLVEGLGGLIQYQARVTKFLQKIIEQWVSSSLPKKSTEPSGLHPTLGYVQSHPASVHLGEVLPMSSVTTSCLEKMAAAEGLFCVNSHFARPDLAPAGYHIIHSFTPSWIEDWQGFSASEYEKRGGSWAHHYND